MRRKTNGRRDSPTYKAMRKLDLKPVEAPKQLSSYFKREKKLLLVMSVSAIIFDGGLSFVPILQGKMIDTIVLHKDFTTVLRTAATYMAAVIIIQGARVGKRFFVRRFANKTGAAMRMMVYNNIMHRDLASLKDEKMGDLLTKAIGDVDISVEGMRKCTTEFFDTGVLMLSYLITLFLQDWKLSLPAVMFIPLSMYIAHLLKQVVTKTSRNAREELSKVTGSTYAMVQDTLLIRTDSLEAETLRSYQKHLDVLQKEATKATILETSMEPLYKAIASIGMVFVLYYGGKNVINGQWTIGSYSAYMTLLVALAVKASKASKLFNSFQKAKVSFARVKPYLDSYQTEDETIRHNVESPLSLSVENLSFTYPKGNKPVIHDISFHAEQGQIIGITGEVATGKTTLGMALEGLYPYQGSIRLGGVELSAFTGFERGTMISYQGHQSELLSESIKENITLGKEGDVTEVLHDVCFDKDLQTMEQGADTLVGSGGVRLSGGQAARISLARALWRHSPLVILDDPFASVDRITEDAIIQNLRLHYRSSLILLISHRLAIFPKTDLVLMLEGNGTAMSGTHQEMLRENADYRDMYTLQMGGAK